jgi:hypothetical protein
MDAELKEWCLNRSINPEIIIKYTQKYFELEYKYLQIMSKEENAYIFLNNLRKKFLSIDSLYSENKLKTSLLFGFPQNLVVKIQKNNKYLSLYSHNFKNIFAISSFSVSQLTNYEKKYKTFVIDSNLEEYLLYLKNDIEREEISMLSNIKISDVLLLSYIYKNEFDIDDETLEFIKDKISKYKEAVVLNKPPLEKIRLNITGSETNKNIIYYPDTLKKVIKDMNANKLSTINNLKFISIVEPDMKYYLRSIDNQLDIIFDKK